MLVEDPVNKRQVLISRLLLSVQPQLSGEMNEYWRQPVGELVYSSPVAMTADQDEHEQLDFLEKIVIENIRQVLQGVRGGQRRASPPANQFIADIKQLPKGGRHSYLITKEQGLCFVYYLCNKPLSSIENLFIHRRCRFDPLSFSPALVLLRTSTTLSGFEFSVVVMLTARLLIAVLALAWGGLQTPTRMTDENSRGEQKGLHLMVSISSSGEQEVVRSSESLHHLWLTRKPILPPLDLRETSGDRSARKSVQPGV